jgi:hypothetical protein
MSESLQYEEAVSLREQYQFLVGTQSENGKVTVESVAVTPYDDVGKYRFFLFYLLLDFNAPMALAQAYHGSEYDVTLIARNADGELLHQPLKTWLSGGRSFAPSQLSTSNYSGQLYL